MTNGARNSRSWLWPALIAGVAAVLVLAFVLSSGGDDDGGSGTTSTTNSRGGEISKRVTVDGAALPEFTTSVDDPAIGEAAPKLVGNDFAGAPVTLGGASGKPQVIVFFAHWCPHCQREVPIIVSLAKGGTFDGIALGGVSTGTTDQAVNYPPSAWLDRVGWPAPVLVDTANQTAAEAYGLTGYPFLVFVNEDGTVAGRWSGEMPEADLEAVVEAFKAGTTPLPFPGG
ncbi:MAG: TlpA family protein disulfide reductase [Actinomycetes bacterium]